MFSQVSGATTLGINGHVITVEVDISRGVTGFNIVGLAAASVKEAKERVRAAIQNSGYQFPLGKVTVNLAPADLKKDGSGLDLPIAIGLLAASGQISGQCLQGRVFIGELSLQGCIRPVPGVLSMAGLTGGGSIPRPGEVTLAHYGVLFLDELPEFPRSVLEGLRQPMEDGEVHIARVNAAFTYPADFMLVAAMNPCPCGYLGDPDHACSCTDGEIRRYARKISGPLLDRIDLHVSVARPRYQELTSQKKGETSREIAARVAAARKIQRERLRKWHMQNNAQMGHRQIKETCILQEEGKKILKDIFDKLHLSARSYNRIIKVSRTIADLEGAEQIEPEHIIEAISYRSRVTRR